MSVLQSRLDQLEMARQAQMNAEHTQSLTEISWGNQIRSYVLHVCPRTILHKLISPDIIDSLNYITFSCCYNAALPDGEGSQNQL